MRKRNDTFAQAIVGFFMVMVLALLTYFTIVISGVELLSGRQCVRLTAAFEQVGGLKDHDNVMYRGTKVGTVERVIVTPSNLVVWASVDGDVVLRTGYRISVCNLSMLGGNYLQLEEGEGDEIDISRTVLHGTTPNDWMSDVSRIAKNLRDLTERLQIDGIVTNLEAASQSAKIVASRIERGEGLVGKLVSGDDSLYEDVRQVTRNAREISERLNRQKLYEDLDTAIADFRAMCAGIAKASTNVAVASEGVQLKSSVERFNAFVDHATALSDNLNSIAVRLKAGEGTLGRLTSDAKLYDEVDGLIRDCRQIIDNYRDTTPISTFTSLATGAL